MKEAEFVKDLLTTLRPDDYLHFIATGETRRRKFTDIH